MSAGDMSSAADGRSLREELADHTRARIFEAMAALLDAGTTDELTIPIVAAKSGVAVRTIYRYFENRDALLDAFWAWVLEQVGVGEEPVSRTNDFPAMIRRLHIGFERRPNLMRAFLASPTGRRIRVRSIPNRRRLIEASFGPLVAHLPADDARGALAVFHALMSASCWDTMGLAFGLSGEETGRAAGWAASVLIAELERRGRAASREKTKSAGARKRRGRKR